MNLIRRYFIGLIILGIFAFGIKRIYSLNMGENKNLNIFAILFIVIFVLSIAAVQINRVTYRKIKAIKPVMGDKGERGIKGEKGPPVNKCVCTDDLCYKKIMSHITLVYNEWCILRGYSKLSINRYIRNKFIKQKVKMMCNSKTFKSLLHRHGSHKYPYNKLVEGIEMGWRPCDIGSNCGVYDYLLSKWRQWILIILKYDNGKYFLDSEDLTDIDFTTTGKHGMITDIDKQLNTSNIFRANNNPIWVFDNPLIFPSNNDSTANNYRCQDFETNSDPLTRCKEFLRNRITDSNYNVLIDKLRNYVNLKNDPNSSSDDIQAAYKDYNVEVAKYNVTLDYFTEYFNKDAQLTRSNKPLFNKQRLYNSDFYKFYNTEGVPSAGGTLLSPFDEIRKFDAWYWGANKLSKPQIIETCKTDIIKDNENMPQIKLKITNNYDKIWDSKNVRQVKTSATESGRVRDIYIPYRDKGRSLLKNDNTTAIAEDSSDYENIDIFRAREMTDINEKDLKFKYYKPLGDVLTNSNYLRKINSKCHPKITKHAEPANRMKNGPANTTLLVSGDVVEPIGFKRRFIRQRKEGADKNKIGYSFWTPIPPPGYKCLGDMISTNIGGAPPDKNSIRCIPDKCIIPDTNNDIKKVYSSVDTNKEDDTLDNLSNPSNTILDTDYNGNGNGNENLEHIGIHSNLNTSDPDFDHEFVEFNSNNRLVETSDERSKRLLKKQNLFRVISNSDNIQTNSSRNNRNTDSVFYRINPRCIAKVKKVVGAPDGPESEWVSKLRDEKYSIMNLYKNKI